MLFLCTDTAPALCRSQETREEVQDSSPAVSYRVPDSSRFHVGELKETLTVCRTPTACLKVRDNRPLTYFHAPELSYKQHQNKDGKGRLLDLCQHSFSFWMTVVQFNPRESGENNSSGLKLEFKKIHLNIYIYFFYLKISFLITQWPRS